MIRDRRWSALTALLTLLALGRPARAEPTLELYIRGAEVFEGDPVSTTVDAEGRIGLGLTESLLTEGPGRPAVALAKSELGIFVATAGAGLIRVRPGREPETLFGDGGLVVSAVAADARSVWFATGPKGRIARWRGGEVESWLDPEPEYVWGLLPDDDAVLAVTGSPARLLRVTKGRARTLFEADESHLRALVRHPTRGLVVGSGEDGVIYEVGGEDEARALYDSELDEVTALAVDPASGDLYAAVVSASKKGALDPGTWIGAVADEKDDEGSPIKGSEVVRIRPTGEVDRIWTSKDEGALGLALDRERGRVLVVTGTGPRKQSRVYAIETRDRDRVILLARLPPPLATGVVRSEAGALLVTTAPDGAVFRLGPDTRASGEYLSVKQDLRRVAAVGRVWFDADVPPGGKVQVSLRTGNTSEPDDTWSKWSAPVADPRGGAVDVPRGRYAQFRARLEAGEKGASPRLRSMHASVRRANLPPALAEVYPLRPGIYLRPIPGEQSSEKTVSLSKSVLGQLRRPEGRDDDRLRVRAGESEGLMTIAWTASDPNGDELLFEATLEPEGRAPVELGEALEVPFVSFDSRAHPDGRYRARVHASDRPSNAPSEALEDERRSEVFVIDNTAPEIDELRLRRTKAGFRVTARARDASSRLGEAEVSIDGGPWLPLPPKDGLLDDYDEAFALDGLDRELSVVRVRVSDERGNRASATVTP